MTRIVACLTPDGTEFLLRGPLLKSLTFFSNFPTVEDACNFLWDSSDHVDFVIIGRDTSDAEDILVAAKNRPQTRFVVLSEALPYSSDAPNLSYIRTLETCKNLLSA